MQAYARVSIRVQQYTFNTTNIYECVTVYFCFKPVPSIFFIPNAANLPHILPVIHRKKVFVERSR